LITEQEVKIFMYKSQRNLSTRRKCSTSSTSAHDMWGYTWTIL